MAVRPHWAARVRAVRAARWAVSWRRGGEGSVVVPPRRRPGNHDAVKAVCPMWGRFTRSAKAGRSDRSPTFESSNAHLDLTVRRPDPPEPKSSRCSRATRLRGHDNRRSARCMVCPTDSKLGDGFASLIFAVAITFYLPLTTDPAALETVSSSWGSPTTDPRCRRPPAPDERVVTA